MATNILTVDFTGRGNIITASESLWQYDYGQILHIKGLDLPSTYAVHFSNSISSGSAETMVVSGNSIRIPDVYLRNGCAVQVFIFISAGEDDGETEYRITIPVIKRPIPDDIEPTPEEERLIDQLLAALNAGVTLATAKAEDASDSADSAAQSAQDAADSAAAAAASEVNAAESETNAADSATSASASAYTSTQKATEAAESAANALLYADRAEQAAVNAGYMYFYITDDGDLIYRKTDTVYTDFYLSDGNLYVRA